MTPVHLALASRVADLVATLPPGTKVIAWSDGDVSQSASSLNPTLIAGAAVHPVAFFVAGIDRPDVEAIGLRIERAFGPGQAA